MLHHLIWERLMYDIHIKQWLQIDSVFSGEDFRMPDKFFKENVMHGCPRS